jgi:thiamine biosynthesis lipoprotein
MEMCDSVRRARPLLGTFVEIASTGAARGETECAVEAAFDAVANVHRLMSFHDPDSDVSRLNGEASVRNVAVNPWTYRVLETAIALHRESNGKFDIAVAPALQKLGRLPRHYGETEFAAVGASSFDSIELLPDCHVRFRDRSVRIDLGGIAKGFAVDRAVDILRAHGQWHGVVNAGGDLAAFGPRQQAIHIRDPREPRRSLCQVAIADTALASSGRSFDPFEVAHSSCAPVIDPATQTPTTEVIGATVRAPSCVIADALTKIVMICGEGAGELLAQYQASALLVLKSGDVRITPDWHDGIGAAA